MKFAGFIKNSFVDYPQNIAAVVFTFGCNFNCWYCHNRQIIEGEVKEPISEGSVIDFLKTRKGFLDGLVISGGEPTLHEDLEQFIKQVKELGLKVKLDTNGTNPRILQHLINEKLIDFVAMDIKTSLDKYPTIIGKECIIDDIKESIKILMSGEIEYEFRTTFAPDVSLEDIASISQTIAGAKSYAIQKYNAIDEDVIKIPHSKSIYLEAEKIAQKSIPNTFLRSID